MGKARAFMVQGTGSNAGKSLIVAGLCRLARQKGISVAPFKPQNMSNNAMAATGGEIGRAQALQALAAGLEPAVDMNPVLLKPESDAGAQVIVQGKRYKTLQARAYFREKATLLPKVLESFERLRSDHDLVIVEGAGSPAEVNLRNGDIANMGFAEAADIPVILVADIDRGGVIANLAGTHLVLPPEEQARIKGYIINRFRGDPSLFDEGLSEITRLTGWRSAGICPWFSDAGRLPAEDGLGLADTKAENAEVKIGVLKIPRIANFDDLDPLRAEPNVSVGFVTSGSAIPGDLDIVILPGSKSTIADLKAVRAEGWDTDLSAHYRRGGYILGLCGGYQMLGEEISDPDGTEGRPETLPGLGYLNVKTVLGGDKTVRQVEGKLISNGLSVRGYEIHLGRTDGPDCERPYAIIDGRAEGATSHDGRVTGTYLHGLFSENSARSAFLEGLRPGSSSGIDFDAEIDATLDRLARHLEASLDTDFLFGLKS